MVWFHEPRRDIIADMGLSFSEHLEFFRQFRARFETTGAVAPSSRFLANAMTGPLHQRKQPASSGLSELPVEASNARTSGRSPNVLSESVRVLEVGPGTGAVTRRIVRLMGPDDRLDLVELNERFAAILKHRFATDAAYRQAAALSDIHICSLQEYESDGRYDFIISGLPLNNFSADAVREIFAIYFRLLAPGGVLSYFEYMWVRPMRKFFARQDERTRLSALDEIMQSYLSRYRFRTSWVFANLPPAWVQHLHNPAQPPETFR